MGVKMLLYAILCLNIAHYNNGINVWTIAVVAIIGGLGMVWPEKKP